MKFDIIGRFAILLTVSLLFFVLSLDEIANSLPPIISLLSSYGYFQDIAASVLAASVVLLFFEAYSQERFQSNVIDDLRKTLINPGDLLEEFKDDRVDEILVACLDRKFNRNPDQSLGMLRFLDNTIDLHQNAHYDTSWDITILPQNDYYDRLRINISLRKKLIRRAFSIECSSRPDIESHVESYISDAHDFTWNFLPVGGDQIAASQFELKKLRVGRVTIPFDLSLGGDETKIVYESEVFDDPLHGEKIQKEGDGTVLFEFEFEVLQIKLGVVATSMRRASRGFRAAINYGHYRPKRVHYFSDMTCADFAEPIFSDQKDIGRMSVEYKDWVFIGSGINFVWSVNDWNRPDVTGKAFRGNESRIKGSGGYSVE